MPARALLPAGLADLGPQRVELAPVVAQLTLGLGPRPLALGLRAGAHGLERVAQLPLAALRVGQRLLCLLPGGARATERLGGVAFGSGRLRQQLGDVQALGGHPSPRALGHAVTEPEPLGDLQRVRGTGPAERER